MMVRMKIRRTSHTLELREFGGWCQQLAVMALLSAGLRGDLYSRACVCRCDP